MSDFRDLLKFKPIGKKQNVIEGFVEWDSNDGDYIGEQISMSPGTLFNDQKLIYVIAYATLPYDFKVKDFDKKKIKRDECRFSQYLNDNSDIDDIMEILGDADLVCYSDWGACHTLETLEMTYYDANGIAKEISFEKIYKEFEGMTYKEICDKINSL